MSTQANDEQILRRLTLEWVARWNTSPEKRFSIERIARLYRQDENLVSYDFGQPVEGVIGWQSFAQYYSRFMALLEHWQLTANDDLKVFRQGNIAWTVVSLKGTGTIKNGQTMSFDGRVTLILEKQEGQWLIVHEHGSTALPFPDQETTQHFLSVD